MCTWLKAAFTNKCNVCDVLKHAGASNDSVLQRKVKGWRLFTPSDCKMIHSQTTSARSHVTKLPNGRGQSVNPTQAPRTGTINQPHL